MVKATIAINYNKGDQTSYQDVTVLLNTDFKYNNDLKKEFNTGNIIKDFQNALAYAAINSSRIMYNCSCDHFVMDGNKYRFNEHNILVEN